MSCLVEILAAAGRDLEPRLASSLHGFGGAIVRTYLPQRWVFVTDDGTASLVVGRDGRFAASAGAVETPDVTVETSHAKLRAALVGRDRSKVPSGPMKVTPHSEKGRTAFTFLRGRLGL